MPANEGKMEKNSGYAPVNGIKIYYEIHGARRGDRKPLVLLHGGLLTIDLTFAKILPLLSKDRQVVAIEQQGHGHTADRDGPVTMIQAADDTAALLRYLKIEQADLFGFSFGGIIALGVAIRHPALVHKLAVGSANFNMAGYHPEIRALHEDPNATLSPEIAARLPSEADFKAMMDDYARTAPDPKGFPVIADKMNAMLNQWQGWEPKDLQAIKAPTLVMIGDSDFVLPEHALEMVRLIPDAQLAILPGTDHMGLLNRKDWLIPMLETFLEAPMKSRG
jgi:pimeloyl-ACP methyl ester carboxylesterase